MFTTLFYRIRKLLRLEFTESTVECFSDNFYVARHRGVYRASLWTNGAYRAGYGRTRKEAIANCFNIIEQKKTSS